LNSDELLIQRIGLIAIITSLCVDVQLCNYPKPVLSGSICSEKV